MRFFWREIDHVYFFGGKMCLMCVCVCADMKMLEMPEYALYEIHESGNN